MLDNIIKLGKMR